MTDSYPDDDQGFHCCGVCGAYMDRETCWQCGGEGGHHDCGEDCCCCLHPENNVTCEECHGDGTYLVCTALPHSDEQMEEYRKKTASQGEASQ